MATGAAVASFILTGCVYVFVMVATTPLDVVPATYKWLLMKSVPGPRLIVASGSNGHYGVDTARLGETLGFTGISFSDNGSYALSERVSAIERYARPGDIVLLPLEWSQYAEPYGKNANYRQQLLTSLQDYFWTAPIDRKLEVLLGMSMPVAVGVLWQNLPLTLLPAREARRRAGRIDEMRRAVDGPGPHGSFAYPASHVASRKPCAPFADAFVAGWAGLRPETRSLLDRLAAVEARGITVVFVPPTTVGDDCYKDPERIDAIAGEIWAGVRARGMRGLGRATDFWLPVEYTDDTIFHVTQAGRAIVTDRLTALLNTEGFAPHASPAMPIVPVTRAAIDVAALTVPDWAFRPERAGPGTEIAVGQEGSFLLLWRDGWSGQEGRGRWTNARRAVAMINVAAPAALTIVASTFSGPRHVTVSVDGRTLGALTIDGRPVPQTVVVPADLSGPCCEITFLDDSSPVTPASMGIGNDRRELGFFLYSIGVDEP